MLLAIGPLLWSSASVANPSASALYRTPVLEQMEISPSGTYLALVVNRKGLTRVALRRRDDGREVLLRKRPVEIRRVGWIDDTHLAIGFGRAPGFFVVATVTVKAGELVVEEQRVVASGYFVDLLPSRGEEVLWAVTRGGDTSVYRLRISELLREEGSPFLDDESRRVAFLSGSVSNWVADRDATVRAALKLRPSSQKSELWYRDSAKADWRLLLESDDPDEIARPFGIAENGRDLVVTSKAGRDTWGLFELSVETGALGRELFADPDADVIEVDYDSAAGEVIAAVYEHEGLTQFHHLDSFFDRYQRSLAHALPDAVPTIASVSRDRRYFVVLASSARDPGTYYVLDTQTNTATRIARMMPWLDPAELADVEAIRVTSTNGLEIEAFLARPSGVAGKPPLVVLPHGGPRAVRDSRSFDPLVQFLAAGGLAVLQVNYRGSSGRGQAFLDAGNQQWGKGIEQDLEAAVDEIVRRGLVDGDRVCIAGGSYGGYSALMSVIRSPTRYRCAASLNGPTDLPFEYHFYFKQGGKEGEAYFSDYIADPNDAAELRSMSPVYRASEIQVPVLLIQGGKDRRVDVDHYYRMLNVLEVLGKPHEAYLIEEAGHSPTPSEWPAFAVRLRAFLSKHLEPG